MEDLKEAASVSGLSLSNLVMISCVTHLGICIGMVMSASSEVPLVFMGVVASTTTQVLNAGFFLLGLPVICMAITGVVYGIEAHLTYYIYYLAATMLVLLWWGLMLLRYGMTCDLTPSGGGAVGMARQSAFACAVGQAFGFFWVLAFFGLLACVMGLVFSLRSTIAAYYRMCLDTCGQPWQQACDQGDEMAVMEAKNHANYALRARSAEGYYLPMQVKGNAGLVKDAKLEGTTLFHVEQGDDQHFKGIDFRSGKDLSQRVPNYAGAPNHSTVAGREVGDGWVKTQRIIPDAAQLAPAPAPPTFAEALTVARTSAPAPTPPLTSPPGSPRTLQL